MSAMSTKPAKRPLRSLTAHEKLVAIRRVHDGESKAAVARDIGVPESTLRGWCKNEEKISYISRQSSPDTDDSVQYEPKEKRHKREDSNGVPFNLSLKAASSRVSYSPNSETYKQDDRPLNLNMNKVEAAKSERERNRAELARLSIELGLNRPENLYPAATGNPLDMNNINLLAQWNSLLMQQKPKTSQPDTSAGMSSQGLLSAFNQEREKGLPKVDPPKSVEDSVWYWLKTQQAMLSMSQNQAQSQNIAGTANMLPSVNATVEQHNSWFWKWYKQYSQHLHSVVAQQLHPQQAVDRILYQQLTKDNSENQTTTEEERPKSTNKARAVLDNLLLNNNNVTVTKKDSKEQDVSQMEALDHGEKFLRWLECCGEPSVTAMQIMQFRGLINNIRSGKDRKNGDNQKTKVRRK